jgi:uncharacterized protein (DUF1778 family)
MKDARITIKVNSNLKRQLEQRAKLKGVTLSNFIHEQILLELHNAYITCEKCRKPMFDKRLVTLTGKGTVKCPHCGFEFVVDFDES